MQPTSSPDNNRPARGLSRRLRPVHRDADAGAASDSPEAAATRSGEPEMFPLNPRPASEAIEFSFPRTYAEAAFAEMTTGAPAAGRPHVPFSPQASARGPGSGPANDGVGPSGGGPGPSGGNSGSGAGSGSAGGDGPGSAGGDGPGPTAGGGSGLPGGGPFGLRPAVPGDGGAPEHGRDADHSGRSGGEQEAIKPVESSRINPWDRDTGTFGAFGLGGRNGRFLFGGRNGADPRPGTNGHHATPVNGVSPVSPAATDGTVPQGIGAGAEQAGPEPASGGPDPSAPVAAPAAAESPAAAEAEPAPGRETGPEATAAEIAAGHDGTDPGEPDPAEAERRDENGREDMNGRAGIPGFPTAGDPAAGEDGAAPDAPAGGRRREAGDAAEPRGSATGWASVPTTTHPVVGPTSGVPTSAAPVSPAFSAYGQPPSYMPALPDPAAGPVSGVPAPRAADPVRPYSAPPASPASGAPAPTLGDKPPATPTSPASSGPAASAVEEPAGFRPLGGLGDTGSGFGAGGFGGGIGSLSGGPGTVDVSFGEVPSPTSDSLRSIADGLRAAGDSLRHIPEDHAPGNHAPSNHAPGSHGPSSHGPSSHGPSSHGTDSLEPRGAHAGADVLPADHPTTETVTGGDEPATTGIQAAGPAQGAVLGSGMTAVPRFGAPPGSRTTEEPGTRRAWDADEPAARTPAPRRSASLEDAEPARRTDTGRSAEATRGRRAAPEAEQGDDGPMRPGDVAQGNIAFWDEDATRHFRAAWHEVKAEFVDDPVTALTRAHDLLTDAVNELTEALLAERDELDPLRGTATPDTESMRMAMRGYREFLERILSL